MKKNILIAVLGVASAVAYGQGEIQFSNYWSSTATTGVTYANGPAAGLGVGPEIAAELYYGASTDTSFTQLTALPGSIAQFGLGVVTGPGPIGTGAGWFLGVDQLIPGTPGDTYAFAILFSGTYNGVDYSGVTGIFTGATAANLLMPSPTLPVGLQQGNFTVSAVPEPGTLALAGLGGFGMLMALRRKKA
jgi:hypothetical protein